ELRIRRGDRQPITVVEFASEPMPDEPPSQSCRQLGESRNGTAAVLGGVLERLGVSSDGSAVVFEVTNDTAAIHAYPLPSDQKGMFLVRADGSGLRRLGPASRDPSFRIGPPGIHTRYTFSVAFSTLIPFSPNGRRIAFTDLGPG